MSASSIRFTHTRAARVNNLFDREYTKNFHYGRIDLTYERPLRVSSLCLAVPLALPAYPGVAGRTFEGQLTFMPPLAISFRSGRRVVTTHYEGF